MKQRLPFEGDMIKDFKSSRSVDLFASFSFGHVRATDGKKTIAVTVGPKDHQRFQASYATILKARMTALKRRERKDIRKGC